MMRLTRRSILRGSLAVAAAGGFARPYIANAQAKTASLWHPQGFVPQEDEALHQFVEDYQKLSGNIIDLSIVPFAPLRQKIISAITSGVVPDLISATPPEVVPLQAWEDRLVDVTGHEEVCLRAAACHVSQGGHLPGSQASCRERWAKWGELHGCASAEGFLEM